MALQGTLDTFALPDVLRLLAATKKTGCLRVTGGRGSGNLWLADGELLRVEALHAPSAAEAEDALFELLRFEEGSFTFDADEAIDPLDRPATGLDVEELIGSASSLLADWRLVEAVVPSLDAYVRPRSVIEADSVTIPSAQWTTLVAVAGGSTVAEVGDALDLPEIPVSRAVRDLVELGVVELLDTDPRPQPTPPVTTWAEDPSPSDGEAALDPGTDAEPAPTPAMAPTDDAWTTAEPDPAADEDTPEDASELSGPILDGDEPLPEARPIRARRPRRAPAVASAPADERFVPLELPGHASPASLSAASDDMDVDELTAAFPGLAHQAGLTRDDVGDDDGTHAAVSEEDLLLERRLVDLPPETAEAVRAAARATTEAERQAVLDAASEDEDAPINRGVLLKFLSSIKS